MPASGPKGALFPNTYRSGAAVVRYRAVMRGADLNHAIQATANAVPLGIATDNQQTAERPVTVADLPGEKVLGEAGAAFSLDALLTSDAAGRLVVCTTTQKVHAIARQAATATGELVFVEIAPRGLLAP
jgi:hypothetical protein